MNKSRMLSLLLAFALSLSCLAVLSSCTGGGDDSSEKQSGSESTDGEKKWYSDLDFNGDRLVVSQSVNVYDSAGSIPNAQKYTRGPEDIGSDTVLNLCYSRNKDVATALNVKVSYVETNYYYHEINPYLDQVAMMSKANVDLVINDVYAVTSAMLKGQLYNLKSDAETNYFNFSHESWYPDYINGLTYDENYVYAMAGDYFMDVVRSAHCLYVNTDIFEVQLKDHYESMKDFYQMISDGNWTFDEFSTLISAGWKSTSGSSSAVASDEYVGFWTHRNAIEPTTLGQDISMVEKTADGYVMVENTANLGLFAEAVCKLYNTDGVLMDSSDMSDHRKYFTEGSALFMSRFWLGDLEYPSFYAMEEKSAIIYPKWTEAADYHTWVHDSAEIGYIMTNTATFTPTSAYCQLLNEESLDIMQEYFEYQLKYKQNTDPEALSMLDLIRDTIVSPFEMYLSPASTRSAVIDAIPANNPAAATNKYESNLPDYRKKLQDKLIQFNAIDEK